MVSLRHPAWVWQGAGVQTTARLLPFVLQCSGTRSPDDWSLYSGCIRLTLRHDVWHMRKKVTHKTSPHSQEAKAWPAAGPRCPIPGFPGCYKNQRSTGTWTIVVDNGLGKNYRIGMVMMSIWGRSVKKKCLPVFWAAFDSHSLGTEATAAWKIEKSGFGKKLMF